MAGSTLYLPVHVQGALLSIGDGHGMQGDGEVTGTALETSLRGTFEVRVRKGQRLRWPRAETPTHYISMGLHEDLDEATRLATREMVEFLVAEKGLSRDDAYVVVLAGGRSACDAGCGSNERRARDDREVHLQIGDGPQCGPVVLVRIPRSSG